MCFSATASFTAGVALSATGVVVIKKARTKRQLPFAFIPLLFGLQQIIEGFVWLSFSSKFQFLNLFTTYAYVFFAYILWPALVPLSVRLLETNPIRRKIIGLLQFLGTAVALYFVYYIIQNPIVSQIVCNSISYTSPSQYGFLIVATYVLAICGSCMVSSHRIINLLGALAGISFAFAYYFYTASYASVWCFFSAILSVCIYWYFRKNDN